MATMAELITQVRQRADVENSLFVTDQELEDYLNDSIADLYCELMARWGDEYFVDEDVLTVAAGEGDEDGNAHQLVPALFAEPPLKILGVQLYLPDEKKLIPLRQFSRNDTVVDVSMSSWRSLPPRYRIVGDNIIEFDRASDAERFVIIQVIRSPIRYDKDVATQITELYAWREYVIVDSVIKVFQKEETDTAALDARKQVLLSRISANAPPRDVQAKTMIDGRSLDETDWRSLWL